MIDRKRGFQTAGKWKRLQIHIADHRGNAALSVQTELLIILPKKVIQTSIIYSKLVVKSQSF